MENDEREPSLAMFERMLAACEFQLSTQLETLDTTIDQQIEAMAVAEGSTGLSLLSLTLLGLVPPLVEAGIPFVVDGVSAAILYGFPLPYLDVQLRIHDHPDVLKQFARTLDLRHDVDPSIPGHRKNVNSLPPLRHIYDLRDPDIHWVADRVQLRVRTQLTDPGKGAVTLPVRYYPEETTVSVVPLHRVILPRTYARALERSRYNFVGRETAERDKPRVLLPDGAENA